jgi:toxin FitB
MNYLLDTCVISELVNKNPNEQVLAWINNVPDEHIFLSVLTVGEIQRGIYKLPDSTRKETLLDWMTTDLFNRFDGRLLPLDIGVALKWGKMVARLEEVGRPLPAIDSLFAAQALTYKMTFVTRNIKDFGDSGVNLLNPWEIE